MKVSLDFAVLDSVFYIRTNPILHFFGYLSAAVDECNSRASPVKFQGCNGGGVLRPDYNNVLIVIGMSLFVVMQYLRQVFTWYVQQVGYIVIARREDDLSGHVDVMTAVPVGGVNPEVVIATADVIYFFILVDIQLVVIRYAAVVFQGLGPIGLLVQASHGNVADFEQLGSGEERHVGRVVIERIGNTALFEENHVEIATLQLDATGESGRTRPH